MLLKHLYDFAHSRGILDDLAFAPKVIRWIIALDLEGRLLGAGPRESAGEKNKGKQYSAPRTSRAKDAGGVAEFLADGMRAVFELDQKPDDKLTEKQRKDRDANNARKHEDFWRQIREAYEATGHSGLQAMLRFRQSMSNPPDFLRWGASAEAKPGEKPAWWIRTASGDEVKIGPDNFTFEVDGELLLFDESLRAYWRSAYAKEVAEKEAVSERGLCLVTGVDNTPIAPTHLPKIKGVPSTQSFGAAIVSFNEPAFASYGFDQSYNAPVSTEAVAAYTNALNWMMGRDDHSIRIGQTTLCFWARESEEASNFFARMLNRPDPQSVAEFIRSPWAGVDRELARSEEFFSVTLAGNAGRVVVRHWMQMTVEAARENLKRWFEDLDIIAYSKPVAQDEAKRKSKRANAAVEGKESMPPLALFRLACATVREPKDLLAETLTQLYRAALEGAAPSIVLLKPILNRLAVDLSRNGPSVLMNISRFALMRLIVNRNRKEGEPMIEPQVFDTDDAAYNCGRLLAIFDDLQMAAHEYKLEGAGVVERYYGSASSAPNSAFGILWRLHQHHLRKLSRQGDKGRAAAEAIKRKIEDIARLFRQPKPNLPPEFPRSFDLRAQGRFALGFYQQKAAERAARKTYFDSQKQYQSNDTDMKGESSND